MAPDGRGDEMKRYTGLALVLAALALCVTATQAGAAEQSFKQSASTTIDFGGTTPYPSEVQVSGVTDPVTKVTVTFDQLFHQSARNIDALLVGPKGQNVMLMSDAGGDNGVNDLIVFDDDAISGLQSPINTGTFRPTNLGDPEFMPAPAPQPPYGSTLAPFEGLNPNGTWQLFILDATIPDSGFLSAWSVNLTTEKGADPGEPLVLGLEAKKQKLKRKLTLNVNASEAGKLTFTGKARGSAQVAVGDNKVKVRIDPGAFKKARAKLEDGKNASLKIAATLKGESGSSTDDKVKVKLK
jgi:subtilisin-like proprotein convertase family protein